MYSTQTVPQELGVVEPAVGNPIASAMAKDGYSAAAVVLQFGNTPDLVKEKISMAVYLQPPSQAPTPI